MYKRITDGVELPPNERVKRFREQSGLTQDELATLCGVRQSTISRVESGKTDPDLALAIELAKAAKARGKRLPIDMWVTERKTA